MVQSPTRQEASLKRVSNIRGLPNAFVVGPQRAGTTWIHQYLLNREDIGVSRRVKEVYYFDRYYHRGPKWYARHFAGNEGRSRIVDVTPTYFECAAARQRIRRDLGPTPIICTLRHPSKRVFSLYLLLRRYGFTNRPFREAAEQLPSILESSRYATQVSGWMELFGEQNVKVLFLEALARDPDQYVRQLCESLDVPYVPVDESLAKSPNPNDALPNSSLFAHLGYKLGNVARTLRLYGLIDFGRKLGLRELLFGRPGAVTVPSMTREDFDWFMQRTDGEIERLEKLLGISLPEWREFPKPKTTPPPS